MRFTYAESMTDPSFYAPLAQAAEAAGYHAMTLADSIAYPFESDSKYPYTPDGNREFLDGKPFVEAFVLASALCAVTRRIKSPAVAPIATRTASSRERRVMANARTP